LRSERERLVQTGKLVAQLDGSEHSIFPVAVSPAEGQALCDWVCRERASRTIEIGLAYGLSALSICEGLLMSGQQEARHVTVDPFQTTGFKDCALQILEQAGVDTMIEHHSEGSEILLPKFLSEGRQFDFAFVDGSHMFDFVFMDLIFLGRILQPGSIVFLDDYQLPAIAKAAAFCVNNLGWMIEDVSRFDEFHQWAIIRTANPTVKRTFPHFVDF
jgi:predicted O-methyltransferase YrrM